MTLLALELLGLPPGAHVRRSDQWRDCYRRFGPHTPHNCPTVAEGPHGQIRMAGLYKDQDFVFSRDLTYEHSLESCVRMASNRHWV